VPVDPNDERVFKIDWDVLGNLAAGVAIVASRFEVIGLKPKGLTIVSITRSGSTATITTTEPHGRSTGDVVTVAGADQKEYNISGAITVTGVSSFTMAITGTPDSPATSTDVLSYSQGLALDNTSILSSQPYDSRVTQVRLSGKGRAYVGRRYEIANRITTDESPAQTKERSFFVVIENL
jgi:hypothetical protein